MRRKEVQKIKEKSVSELQKDAASLKVKTGEMRRDLVVGKLKNPRLIGQTRKDIARLLTVMNEKKMMIESNNTKVTKNDVTNHE